MSHCVAPKEAPLVTAILQLAYLQRHLIRLARTQSGRIEVGRSIPGGDFVRAGYMTLAEEGWPDITGFVPARMPKRSGKAILVECKRSPEEVPTDLQIANLTAIVDAGGIGILAWDAAQFWAEYLDAIGMEERDGLIVPSRKPRGVWKRCECEWRAAA